MRITSSNVALSSSQINISSRNVHEYLRAWDKTSELTFSAESAKSSITKSSFSIKDLVAISPDAAAAVKNAPKSVTTDSGSFDITDEEYIGDLKSRIIKDIIERMTGKKINVFNPDDIDNENASTAAHEGSQTAENGNPASPQQAGWGIDYQYSESSYTKEGVSFTAAGSVTTADGRSIKFSTSLEMSRESYEQINISVKAGDALIDPLVMDLTGGGAGFSDVKFEFDLDTDGTTESISAPRAGTGFLAVDNNGNGLIDDGTELFGPQTGNGFSELSRLDDDNNGWIDENDTAFAKLGIWQKGADGTDRLSSLLQNDIGAIYTGKASTNYSLTDNANRLAGMLRESGIYLRESGGAGVIQEVDIVV
jgi:hypothetical protein